MLSAFCSTLAATSVTRAARSNSERPYSMDRITPTQRPNERPIGYQTWSNLAFVHWRLPAKVLRPLIPKELEIDTFDGEAWLGLVPFYMSGVRPWWSPAVRGISNFCETNLRTYVHFKGANPGVWFFSLDAASSLAVWIARTRWCLNYFHAHMAIEDSGSWLRYHSHRLNGKAQVGIELSFDCLPADAVCHAAVPGTLEHFLAERYLLYSTDRAGRLYRGQVHHQAYPLRLARLVQCIQSLTKASRIDVSDSPDHVVFSPGVNVDIFPLRPVIS